MNRQIKADNALLLEIKKQIKKLSAIVVDKVKKTVLDFANTLENLRNRYIFNRYEITQNENISTELKQYNTTIDVTVQRYNGIVQQLDNKITELKKMKAEQKHLNPIHIFRHKELTEHIDKTEKEIKKLQNLKSAFLDKMSCKSEKDIPQYKALHIKNDDIIIEIAANNTELEKQCADDKAEFISIKKVFRPKIWWRYRLNAIQSMMNTQNQIYKSYKRNTDVNTVMIYTKMLKLM